MSSRSFEFSIHYQRQLLHRILWDRKYAAQAIPIIREEVFDTEPLKWICRKIKSGSTTVRIQVTELKLEGPKLKEEMRKALKAELQGFLKQYDEDESKYAIEQLKEFVEHQDITESLKDAAIKAEAGGKAAEIREILTHGVFSVYSFHNTVIDPIATYRERFAERRRVQESGELIFVSSGFRNIDRDIGGPRLGQIWAYFGDTNVGKSQAAVAAGVENVIANHPTLHFSLEDLMDITLQRYDACFTQLTHTRLTHARLTPDEQRIVDGIYVLLQQRRSNILRVAKIEEGATVEHLYSEYRRVKARDSFHPQVILVDSPHNMDSTRRSKEYRLEQKFIYKELRAFAQQENVAVILYDQTNQQARGKKAADTGAASESYDKARIVDGFITMNQNKFDLKDRIVRLFTAKMKDREKHKCYLARENFKMSRYIPIFDKEEV